MHERIHNTEAAILGVAPLREYIFSARSTKEVCLAWGSGFHPRNPPTGLIFFSGPVKSYHPLLHLGVSPSRTSAVQFYLNVQRLCNLKRHFSCQVLEKLLMLQVTQKKKYLHGFKSTPKEIRLSRPPAPTVDVAPSPASDQLLPVSCLLTWSWRRCPRPSSLLKAQFLVLL